MTQLTLATWVNEAPESQRERRRTIAERYQRHRERHPEVFALLRRLAVDAVRKGRSRLGMKALWERVRWEFHVERDEEFKLDNSIAAVYARALADEVPELRDVFEFRERRTA